MAAPLGGALPGVDIVLIEPDATDELMFQTSIMNFASRIAIARHGFQSVAHHLAGEYERYRQIAKRHGIEISPERLRTVVEHFEAEEPEQSIERVAQDPRGDHRRAAATGRVRRLGRLGLGVRTGLDARPGLRV